MDQIRTGNFIRSLRKEKNLTQEQLAEHFNVSRRTVSRWETGANVPDLDLLIEIADYFEVDLRELLDGERKEEHMNTELKETVLKVADYSNEEKSRMLKRIHNLYLLAIAAFGVYMVMDIAGVADMPGYEFFADFCLGLVLGMILIGALFTSRYGAAIRAFKKRLLHRESR